MAGETVFSQFLAELCGRKAGYSFKQPRKGGMVIYIALDEHILYAQVFVAELFPGHIHFHLFMVLAGGHTGMLFEAGI